MDSEESPFTAKVQPLRAGAIAGYLEAFRAATEQTSSTCSPDHPITADEHLVRAAATAHVCAVPEECHTCHPRTAGILERERTERCAKCSFPFRPDTPRAGDSPYCARCVQRCHDSRSVLHLCEICR